MSPRNLALSILNDLNHRTDFPRRYLEKAFHQNLSLNHRDRAFAVHLVQGVLRWRLRLDWIIRQTLHFPFERIDLPVLNILRIALYQIYHMDRVPESAAVNEAVKQAKKKGKNVGGFVNGVLRQICREKPSVSFPDRQKDLTGYLSLFYSYPKWLVQKWIRELGNESTEQLLKALNRIPHLVVRVNRLKTDRSNLIDSLKKEGVTCKPTSYSPDGIEIESMSGPVNQLKAFKQGLFQVQDEAAQVCSYLIGPKPGDSVLDLCSGLGGKATHLAQIMDKNGQVLAVDKDLHKLKSLKQNCRRLKIDCVYPIVTDASNNLSNLFYCSFEKILVDGPCSGLGVISRHPDGKWTKNTNKINRLSLIQRHILHEAGSLMPIGGRLLYVTCTISKEENEGVVKHFLRNNRKMVLENLNNYTPEWCRDLIDEDGFFRTLPHVHGMDGFFGAMFLKK